MIMLASSQRRFSVRATSAALAILAGAAIGLAASDAKAKDIKVCLLAGKTGAFEAYAKQTEAAS